MYTSSPNGAPRQYEGAGAPIRSEDGRPSAIKLIAKTKPVGDRTNEFIFSSPQWWESCLYSPRKWGIVRAVTECSLATMWFFWF